jgi:phosphate-selective porin OprO and OprP
MNRKFRFLASGMLFLLLSLQVSAQNQMMTPSPYFTYGKGLGITTPDSLFMLSIRFRVQNRFAFTTEDVDDLSISSVEARVRRMRLRFDGFIYNPRLTYILQLSFSRGDLDFDDTGFPNVLRDAMVMYQVSKKFTVALGQGKLPGNRQRVVSSGDLQLADRSIVNSAFNIDRDFGLQLYYRDHVKNFHYVLRGSMSSGEGRNINQSDQGLAYTGRIEFLPFGTFKNNGDYFEGDLERESTPKVSVGLTYSDNENSIRTGGQLGKPLYEARDIETYMADFLFKYKGWALSSEYLDRKSVDPITEDGNGDQRFVYDGYGLNVQGSHLFQNNYELVGRYSKTNPNQTIALLVPLIEQFTIGVTKYVKGHRVKLQTDVTYERRMWQAGSEPNAQNWQVRFQVEAGI